MRTTILLAAALTAALALSATALASRAPTRTERVAIVAAWSGSPTTLADTQCRVIRVSTARAGWAALRARFTKPCRGQAFDGSTFLRKRDGKWGVVIGGSSVDAKDCRLIPLAVRRDLPAFTSSLGC
ncbi:MAG: hypothetical protein R3C15_02650 [Thermoleophilia bacterium]